LTRVHENFEGDAFFPEMNPDEWVLVSNRDCAADEKNPFALSFQVWERK
jgi:dihydrofolate reductase